MDNLIHENLLSSEELDLLRLICIRNNKEETHKVIKPLTSKLDYYQYICHICDNLFVSDHAGCEFRRHMRSHLKKYLLFI